MTLAYTPPPFIQIGSLFQQRMKPFSELSKAGQVRRLSKLVWSALAEYDIEPKRVEPVNHGENSTFRVIAAEGKFVMRVNRPFRHTNAQIESEMMWLADLRDHSYINVPNPVKSKNGNLYVSATADGVPEVRSCVLFKWLEGRIYTQTPTPNLFEKLGRTTAVLHNFVSDYKPPNGFVRKDVTWEGEGNSILTKGLSEGINFLKQEDVDVFLHTLSYVKETADSVGRSPATFNLIHADLHLGNCLFHRGDISVIDFDDSGYGYFMQDIGTTLWYVRNRSNFSELRASLLRGYGQKRSLPLYADSLIQAFTLNRSVELAMWLAGRVDHPEYRKNAPEFVANIGDELRSEMSLI